MHLIGLKNPGQHEVLWSLNTDTVSKMILLYYQQTGLNTGTENSVPGRQNLLFQC